MTFAVPRERFATSAFGQERTYYLWSAAEAAEALDHLTEAMQEADYAEKDRFSVRLAVEEAGANTVKHGHQPDPQRPDAALPAGGGQGVAAGRIAGRVAVW